ncbi:MAG: NAD(P)H-dependent oxidoreductase [Methylococcaceae bacterium]|nr:NAD(P)H-dependent oxidoreductase [Methylococcaceae bacterium]
MTKILAFSGSARVGSYNQKLVRIAARGAEQAGAEVTIINLADYPMPVYNQDLEISEGLPPSAKLLKSLFISHDGLLIASPEYNSAFTPLLKNTLDWISRREGEDASLVAFRNKIAVIMAASPGGLGGLRGLVFLRMLLSNFGVIVLPEQLAVPHADKAFDEDDQLIEKHNQDSLLKLGAGLAQTLKKLQ